MLETTPSIIYTTLYQTCNTELDQLAFQLCRILNGKGHASIFMPRDGYGDIRILVEEPTAAFSQVYAAKYAGLGTVGFNHTLLTPEYGPRVRFVSVFTTLKTQGGKMIDPRQELHVWRTNGKWKARLRRDGEGENAEAIVAHQLLFGTKGERLSSRYARIREDRGTKLLLPLADVQFDEDEKGVLKERVFIKTHNYIRYNAVHQATYFDCRFVAFTNGQNELS